MKRGAALVLALVLTASCDEPRRIPGATGGGGGGARPDATSRDATSRDGASGDGATDGTDGGSSSDAGGRDGGPFDPPGPDVGAEGRAVWGSINLLHYELVGQRTTTLSAAFFRGTAAVAGCSTRTDGPCEVTRCGAVGGGTPTALDGGEVSAQAGAARFAVRFDATSNAYGFDARPNLVTPGTRIAFEVVGRGDVPPMSVELVAPAQLTLLSPEIPGPNVVLAAPPSAPLALTWRADGTGEVYVAMGAGPEMQPAVSAICTFRAGSGSGAVPASVLRALADVAMQASFSVDARASARVEQVDVDVGFNVFRLGRTVDGMRPSATLDLR